LPSTFRCSQHPELEPGEEAAGCNHTTTTIKCPNAEYSILNIEHKAVAAKGENISKTHPVPHPHQATLKSLQIEREMIGIIIDLSSKP
jgi:hypothetical protein